MSREMMKAGVISEMIEDVLQDDELEEEAEEEVEKVMHELIDDVLLQAGSVGRSDLKVHAQDLKEKQIKEHMEFLNS